MVLSIAQIGIYIDFAVMILWIHKLTHILCISYAYSKLAVYETLI